MSVPDPCRPCETVPDEANLDAMSLSKDIRVIIFGCVSDGVSHAGEQR
ncbi:hypothetical protein C8D96_2121 [Kushneria marisflavi]|nr:hypothetical protein C8D96_2121 [Kushneria marisflavi]